MWNEKTRRELRGLALVALALITFLSLIPVGAGSLFATGNIMGVLGAAFARACMSVFGVGSWGLPVVLAISGIRAFEWLERERAIRFAVLGAGLTLLVPVGTALVQGSAIERGTAVVLAGWIGYQTAFGLMTLLGGVGAWLVLTFLTAALLVLTLGWNPLTAALRGAQTLRISKDEAESEGPLPNAPVSVVVEADDDDDEDVPEEIAELPGKRRGLLAAVTKRDETKTARKTKGRTSLDLEEFGDPASDDLPPMTLLSEPPQQSASLSEAELDRLGQVLIQTLRTFKVEGSIGGRTTGPVVTQFEVVPAPGVKVNRIAHSTRTWRWP